MCVAENGGRPPELRVNLRAQPARRGRPQSYNRREVISVNNPGARRRPLSLGSNWTCTDTLISVWKTLSRRPSSSCLASWPPRNCEVINGYCLKPLSLWYLLCSPQQRTQEVTEGRDPGGEGKETVSSRRGSPSSSPTTWQSSYSRVKRNTPGALVGVSLLLSPWHFYNDEWLLWQHHGIPNDFF